MIERVALIIMIVIMIVGIIVFQKHLEQMALPEMEYPECCECCYDKDLVLEGYPLGVTDEL